MKRLTGTIFDDNIKKTRAELLRVLADAKAKLQQTDESDVQARDESTSSPANQR